MKSLKEKIQEEMATPSNTMGAGNPSLPGPNGETGSGDTFVGTVKPNKSKTIPIKKIKQKKGKGYKKDRKGLLKKLECSEEE